MSQHKLQHSLSQKHAKILITGSSGLIGSNLKISLEKIGYRIESYDLPKNILDKDALKHAAEGCVGIIHLAAVSRVIDGEKNPDLCWNTNVEGAKNVIKTALACSKTPWIIYASSREVYGQQDILPVKENCVLKPMNIYAESKVAAEKLMTEAREHNINISILRFSNVFGDVNDHDTRVIPAFCKAALLEKPLKLEGKNNIFDFTYIDDVISGILKVVQLLQNGEKNLPPIHFTTGIGTSLSEAANCIIRLSHSNSSIVEAPSRSFDVSRFCGDNQLAYKILNWSPKFTFEESIQCFLSKLTQNHKQKIVKGIKNEDYKGYSRVSTSL